MKQIQKEDVSGVLSLEENDPLNGKGITSKNLKRRRTTDLNSYFAKKIYKRSMNNT